MGERELVQTGTTGTTKTRVNAHFTDEQMKFIKEVAARRGTSESGAVRFLTNKGIQWWKSLDATAKEVA